VGIHPYTLPLFAYCYGFFRICPENKRIREGLVGAKSATKGAFRNKGLFDIHAVTNINLMAVAGCCAEIEASLQACKTEKINE